MRAAYNALNAIQTSVNNSLRESNAEVLELQAELILKNHEIAALSSISDNISFFQLLWTNYNFIQCKPLPLKLAIGGTVTYKIFNKIMSSDENKKNLKENSEGTLAGTHFENTSRCRGECRCRTDPTN